MKTTTIIKRTIGYLIIAHIAHLGCFIGWVFTEDYHKYKWYIPFCVGYMIDGVFLAAFAILIVLSLLFTED